MTENESAFSIQAKVAAVVAESQMALNAGSAAGVREGDEVVLHRHVDVMDPDSNEKLGSVTYPRLQLRVNHVQDKMCVAVVTDQQAVDNPLSITAVRRLKRVTVFPSEANKGTVLVTIGEPATIRRHATADEPPF